ncbi:O-antigen ligase family protein [Morganella morganii]|uniref:O-antigen ligase family protein n=1 Tax=Morganella morganii TaxID=582 RepID=UPI001299B9F9|nr:O-antigen ligase family protein [Morganella morganii]MBT0422511.1 O-antigen ligase family protein [Morganella morganii subsp. morganii]MBT0517072.1 O-antigen ligase family protein [Morganella morganii subsp. morganii]MRE60217.1 O-antigen ligase domain-containing protein [Morganella morganii]QWM04152.1 O-antigen ligase family protein [Morganella morganii subsp. morganii]HDU8648034.1 O-antigen ligase family protein [Morganella morganii subsp. morganii]
MNILRDSQKIEKMYFFMFSSFLFFSAIFCGFTKVNNLFHIAIVLFYLGVIFNPDLKKVFFTMLINKKYFFIFTCLFFIYYSLTNIWGGNARNLTSTLTHGFYLFTYLSLLIIFLENEKTRYVTLKCIVMGVSVLCLYTLFTDPVLLMSRRVTESNPGPSNVIDLAGYCGIAILIALLIFNKCKDYIMILCILSMAVVMFLTLSRGPIISFFVALILLIRITGISNRALFIMLFTILFFSGVMHYYDIFEKLVNRFTDVIYSGGVRMGIWQNAFDSVKEHLLSGRGVEYKLNFVNKLGQDITTAHSVYMGTLLKGGIIGLALFFLMIFSGVASGVKQFIHGERYGLAILIFMLIFISSQGMFVIGNPNEQWILFWLPLAIAMSNLTPADKNKTV